MLKGRTAHEQLPLLKQILAYNGMDFMLELKVQQLLVYLNFAFWVRSDLTPYGLSPARKIDILQAVQKIWTEANPGIALIGSKELDGLALESQP